MSLSAPIALETNGIGYLGFLSEFLGAFVRGKTINEALAKVEHEVKIYQKWWGMEVREHIMPEVIQIHKSSLKV